MLDLIREIAGHERHHRVGVDVAAAQHLAQIPLPLGLALQVALRSADRSGRIDYSSCTAT
jgi:hypothetical protein